MLVKAFFVGASVLLAADAEAAILFSDSFQYTPGNQVTAGGTGWTTKSFINNPNYSSPVSATDLSFPGLASAGGSVKLHGVEVTRSVTGLSSQSQYWVSARFKKADANGRLSVMFRNTAVGSQQVAGFGLAGAGVVQAGEGSFSSANTHSSWTASTGATVSAGTTALLLARLDVPNKTISVWNVTNVNSVSSTPDVVRVWSATVAPGAIGTGYNYNYSLSVDQAPTNLVDEIKIATASSDLGITFVPEPASLGALAGAGMLSARRRRR